ncbi:MAG: pyridoxal phosphate-dependent aminotransferase [Christensenellales bacterium]
MKEFWSKRASRIDPYTPGEQPRIFNLIKLNTNESPYPPAPAVIKAIQSAPLDRLRLYCDPQSAALCSAIAQVHGVSPEQVFVGNGSDEILAFCFLAYFDNDTPVALPDISYSFYKVYAQLFDIPVKYVPLNPDFSLPAELFTAGGGCVLANPNAPTSVCSPLDDIKKIASACPRATIVDEAYIAFGGQSALPVLDQYPNMVIVRTFSKSHSLAGMRIGYAIASPDMIQAINTVKNSFNSYPLDMIAQIAGKAAIESKEYYDGCAEKIIEVREQTAAALQTLGFTMPKSSANFLFARHSERSGAFIMQELRSRSILVRRFEAPRIKDYLRITIGTMEQMNMLIEALKEILK